MPNETEGHGRAAKQKAVLEALRTGNTRRAAAAYASIDVTTFYEWLKIDPTFSNAVEKAEADAEVGAVAAIRKAGQKSWQAHAWWLERNPRTKQDWKRLNEIDWRNIPAEVLLALLGAGEGDPGAESQGDRVAIEEGDPGAKPSNS